MLNQELEKIGLSVKEASVYLAALQLGQAAVQKIATEAKVNRATTYVILESLTAKGLISTQEKGKKRLFQANGPYSLMNFLRKQKSDLAIKKGLIDTLLPKLQKIHTILPNRAVVRYFEGKEALLSINEQILESRDKEVFSFYSFEEFSNVFSEEEMNDDRKRREEKKLFLHAIYNPGEEGQGLPAKDVVSDRKTVPKDKFHFPCNIKIFDDFLVLSILSGALSCTVIESKSIADSFRSIFRLAAKASEKYKK